MSLKMPHQWERHAQSSSKKYSKRAEQSIFNEQMIGVFFYKKRNITVNSENFYSIYYIYRLSTKRVCLINNYISYKYFKNNIFYFHTYSKSEMIIL